MSFTVIEEGTFRVNRSQLSVPGSSPKFFEKAAAGEADVVFLDLEDSVAPEQKEAARQNVIGAINDIDWGGKTLSVRINGLDTPYAYRDLIDVLEQTGERLDLFMIPKVGTAADVYAVDMLVSQVEMATGRSQRTGLELIIESALGMANIDAIAGASKRLEALHFGAADFAASIKARTTQIGGSNQDYSVLTDPDEGGARQVHWGDQWHYAIQRMVIAARANGLRAIDGPFGDYSDDDGFRAHANRAAVLGCEGKWAIHPRQVTLANDVFTPSGDDLERAKRILEAMDKAQKEGQGAAALDGRLIDLASIRQARTLVAQAGAAAKEQTGGRAGAK